MKFAWIVNSVILRFFIIYWKTTTGNYFHILSPASFLKIHFVVHFSCKCRKCVCNRFLLWKSYVKQNELIVDLSACINVWKGNFLWKIMSHFVLENCVQFLFLSYNNGYKNQIIFQLWRILTSYISHSFEKL